MTKLEEIECGEADDGYIGKHPQHIKCLGVRCADPERRDIMQCVQSRQETVNKRFKTWEILSQNSAVPSTSTATPSGLSP